MNATQPPQRTLLTIPATPFARAQRARASRSAVPAVAVVIAPGRQAGPYSVELSALGARLVGKTLFPVDACLRLVVQLLASPHVFALEARVVHHEEREGRAAFVVRFLRVSATVQEALHAAVLQRIQA